MWRKVEQAVTSQDQMACKVFQVTRNPDVILCAKLCTVWEMPFIIERVSLDTELMIRGKKEVLSEVLVVVSSVYL